jgi:hypothetical protein
MTGVCEPGGPSVSVNLTGDESGNEVWIRDRLKAPRNDEKYDSDDDQNQGVDQPEPLQEVNGGQDEEYDSDDQTYDAHDRPCRAFGTHDTSSKGLME